MGSTRIQFPEFSTVLNSGTELQERSVRGTSGSTQAHLQECRFAVYTVQLYESVRPLSAVCACGVCAGVGSLILVQNKSTVVSNISTVV